MPVLAGSWPNRFSCGGSYAGEARCTEVDNAGGSSPGGSEDAEAAFDDREVESSVVIGQR